MSKVTFKWYGERVRAVLEHGSSVGSKKAAEHLLDVSQTLVPREFGELERSGEVVKVPGGHSVQYGGNPSEPIIAIVQHEDLTLQHPNGRQAKYLESPMLTEIGTIFFIMGSQLRDSLSKE